MNKQITIQRLSSQSIEEFAQVICLFKRVFELPKSELPQKKYLQNILNDNNFLVFVAKEDGKIIGGLTIYLLNNYHNEQRMAFLYDLAVEVSHQRKGIGKMLIKETNQYCKLQNVEEVFLCAENDNEYAINFYRKTKPSGEDAVTHFYYKLSK